MNKITNERIKECARVIDIISPPSSSMNSLGARLKEEFEIE